MEGTNAYVIDLNCGEAAGCPYWAWTVKRPLKQLNMIQHSFQQGNVQHSTAVMIIPEPQGHGGAFLALNTTASIDEEPGWAQHPTSGRRHGPQLKASEGYSFSSRAVAIKHFMTRVFSEYEAHNWVHRLSKYILSLHSHHCRHSEPVSCLWGC